MNSRELRAFRKGKQEVCKCRGAFYLQWSEERAYCILCGKSIPMQEYIGRLNKKARDKERERHSPQLDFFNLLIAKREEHTDIAKVA